jgi:hypothetical protein
MALSALPDPVGLTRRDLLAGLFLAGLLALLAVLRAHPEACGQCHDDAIYVINARALAEGDGYRLTNLPGSPPQTKYPILYPALVALLWKVWPAFPENLVLLQGFSVACGAAFVALSYLFLIRFGYATRRIAFVACLVCLTSPLVVRFSGLMMSEMPFGVLTLLAFGWLEAARRSPGPRPLPGLLGGVLLALPYLCRSLGVPFIPLGLFLLWRSGRRVGWVALGAAVAVLPWLVWTATALPSWQQDPVLGYYTNYFGWWATLGAGALPRVVGCNTTWVVSGVATVSLDGPLRDLVRPEFARLWAFLLLVLSFAGVPTFVRDLLRGRTLPVCLAGYLAVAIVWPWPPYRFLLPLLPLLVAYFLRGLMHLADRPSLVRIRPVLVSLFLAVAVGGNLRATLSIIHARIAGDAVVGELGPASHAWRSSRRLLDWLKEHSRPDDVIAAGDDGTVALYTGRRAVYPIVCPPLPLFYGYDYPTEEVYAQSLRVLERLRPRYLSLSANFHGEAHFRAWLSLLLERQPFRLECVYRDPQDPRFAVYAIYYDGGGTCTVP